jgi:hypothetical protein
MNTKNKGVTVLMVFIGYILHETYQNAKSEVEYENQKIIRNIKTGY